MEAQVRIGANRRFILRNALLVYGDGSGAFATLHEVRGEKDGAPYLGPGQSLTTAFLRSLAHGLRRRKRRSRKAQWPHVSASGVGFQDLGRGSLCARSRDRPPAFGRNTT